MVTKGDIADKIDGRNQQNNKGENIVYACTRTDMPGGVEDGQPQIEITLQQKKGTAGMEYPSQEHAKKEHTNIDVNCLPAVGVFLPGVCVSGLHVMVSLPCIRAGTGFLEIILHIKYSGIN